MTSDTLLVLGIVFLLVAIAAISSWSASLLRWTGGDGESVG
ncbi:MAG TPA: hypothetical protein VLA19_14195 [Herpetosiphonaceae bacterium]|nr:hypothetical protein [Herpetosiphonaceae bacterium]